MKEKYNNEINIYSIPNNNLSVGMTFKNYNKLCEFLGQPICQGNSKKYQLVEWERYFDYEKNGQKIIIVDIYEEPLQRIDGRLLTRNDQYIKYIEDILLCYLYVNEETSKARENGGVEITTKNLYSALGMINKQFYDRDKGEPLLHCYKDEEGNENTKVISNFNIRDFYKRSENKLNRILVSAMNNMQRRCLIKYSLEYKICYLGSNNVNIYKRATEEDIRKILDAERYTLNSMGFASKTDLYLKNKADEFYEKCIDYVQIMYRWEFYYGYYNIITGNNTIKDEVKNKLSSNQQNKISLNNNIIKALNDQAKNKYLKSKKEKELGLSIFSFPNEYVEIQKELANYLIRIPENKLDNDTNNNSNKL